MIDSFVKVVYSKKYLFPIIYLIALSILIDIGLIIINFVFIINLVSTVIILFFICYLVYLTMNRISEITYCIGKFEVKRFLLKDLVFECKDIVFVNNQCLKIGRSSFNLRYVVNKEELLVLILNAMNIVDTNGAINEIINGKSLYKEEEDLKKEVKNQNIAALVIIILMIAGFITRVITEHWDAIFLICCVIYIFIFFIKEFAFSEKVDKINSRFQKVIASGIINIVCILLTIGLGFLIYKIFRILDIDLIKIKI